MIRTRTAAVAALAFAALASRAHAQIETAAAAARSGFELSIISPHPELQPYRRSVRGSWQNLVPSAPMRAAGVSLLPASLVATVNDAAAPAAEIGLSDLLNRQLRTSLQSSLGGKTVWVGGAFDRQQNAYVSILIDGQPAQFFNVRSLLEKEQTLPIGTARYKLYLAPNVINQLKSEVILENAANEDEKVRITLKRMMDAVAQTGQAVTLGGQSYRVFYTDDVRNGQADASAKVFTFLLVDGRGEIHVFIIPAELIPDDKIAVFKMFEDKRVGLLSVGGRLKVYENP